MFIKIVAGILATLAYVYLLTVIFEYCLNEASSTLLTSAGVLLIILFTSLYIFFLYRMLRKRRPKYLIHHD